MKPNFLVIGAQRAGTTWLYECLREHPEIFLPETKELHYFDLNHEKGYEWYFQHFEGASEKAIGEITPNYYQYPGAIEKAHALLPEAKFIFILREPKAKATVMITNGEGRDNACKHVQSSVMCIVYV